MEPKLHRGREGGEKSEKLSRQWLLPRLVSKVLFDPLKKTSDNERSCAEDAENASLHDQHLPSSNL